MTVDDFDDDFWKPHGDDLSTQPAPLIRYRNQDDYEPERSQVLSETHCGNESGRALERRCHSCKRAQFYRGLQQRWQEGQEAARRESLIDASKGRSEQRPQRQKTRSPPSQLAKSAHQRKSLEFIWGWRFCRWLIEWACLFVDIQLGAKVLFIAYALDGQSMGGL